MLVNYVLVVWLGVVVVDYFFFDILKWVLVVSFFVMVGWIFILDKLDGEEFIFICGFFVVSFIVFFMVEIGDKI